MKLKLLTYYIDYQHDDKIIILFQQTLNKSVFVKKNTAENATKPTFIPFYIS